ncbi:MAG: phytanoyl-CoA dioxygenase family protein [Pseudomonadales bacterium]
MEEKLVRHVEKLKKDGYCYVQAAFSSEQVNKALNLVKSYHSQTAHSQAKRMPFLNRDQPMVYNLQSKDLFFIELLFANELMQDILKFFLNDRWYTSIPEHDPNYILRSYLARSSNLRMPMHIDSFIPYTGPEVFVMQCAIVLEDQTEENGCTVIVPGSHLFAEYTNQDAFDQAIPIESRAGDLVIWDSRVWHGATENRTADTRWSVIGTFSRWWLKQAFNIPGNLPQHIYNELTDSQKAVLGFCSVPYGTEMMGIDMKRSYDLLPVRVEDYQN